MRHAPFFARVQTPELLARHEEDAPALEPDRSLVGAVVLVEDWQDLLAAPVHICEPVAGGAGVVGAVEIPVVGDDQIALKMVEEVGRGHQAAGEKVLGHPIVAVADLEEIGVAAVAEHVEEDQALRPQPSVDMREDLTPVAQVFEHFDGDDAVEAFRGGGELVGVAGDDLHIVQSTLAAARLDIAALAVRIRDGGDAGLRVALGHPQGQRTPATAQFEDVPAVGELGSFAVEGQHLLFGLVEGFAAGRIVAAAVFAALAEDLGEKGRWQLVVLVVGFLGEQGHRLAVHRGEEIAFGAMGRFAVGRGDLADAVAQQAADADADQGIGDQAAFGQADGVFHGRSFRGNQGTKALVRRW